MTPLSAAAVRVQRVLAESGPRSLNLTMAIATRKPRRGRQPKVAPDPVRVLGELFVAGMIEWAGKRRARRVAASVWMKRHGRGDGAKKRAKTAS